MENVCTYTVEDWIVHTNYGVGQIKDIETKCISGEEKQYYRVETPDSTFWMPVDQMDSDVLRPLSTPDEILEAIDVFQKPVEEMPSNIKVRQSHIRDIQKRNTPRAMARLLRDLRAFKRKKGVLNNTESTILRNLTQRFASEWAIVTGVSRAKTLSKLERLLDPRRSAKIGQDDLALSNERAAASNASKVRSSTNWKSWPKRQINTVNR